MVRCGLLVARVSLSLVRFRPDRSLAHRSPHRASQDQCVQRDAIKVVQLAPEGGEALIPLDLKTLDDDAEDFTRCIEVDELAYL